MLLTLVYSSFFAEVFQFRIEGCQKLRAHICANLWVMKIIPRGTNRSSPFRGVAAEVRVMCMSPALFSRNPYGKRSLSVCHFSITSSIYNIEIILHAYVIRNAKLKSCPKVQLTITHAYEQRPWEEEMVSRVTFFHALHDNLSMVF